MPGIPPVEIMFAVGGITDVGRSIDSVERRLQLFEKNSQRTTQQASRQRTRAAQDEAKAKLKAEADVQRAAEKAERLKTREAQNQGRLRQQFERRNWEMNQRFAAQAARESEQLERQKTRELEREEERRMRIKIRSSEMAGRYAAQQANAEIAAQRRATSQWSTRGRRVGGIAMGAVGGVLGTAATMATATLGLGGGMMLADAARREFAAEKQAGLLINTVTTGKAPPPEATLGNILGKAGQLSKDLGIDKETIVTGALEYSRKARGGDIKGSLGNMGFFAEMSKVTGASIEDIAGAAGTLQSQNQNLDTAGMRQMLLDVYAQGKAGSLSMVDVSKQLGVMASARGAFSGDVATNQRKLLALGQLAAPEGSPEEAGTFIKDLVMEAGKHRKSTRDSVGLEQMGVKFDKFGRMESPEQMIDAVFKGTGGDITKIEKIFGARGKALFGALLNPYTSAGGGAAGIAAVNQTLAGVTGATMTEAQLHAQNAQLDATPGQRFHNALNKATIMLEDKMAPGMEKLADKLPAIVDKFGDVVDAAANIAGWMSKDWPHTFAGIGAIVSLAIAKDLASAGISAAAEKGVAMLFARLSGMSLGGGGIGAAGSFLGKAGLVGAAGAAGAGLAYLAVNADADAQSDANRSSVGRRIDLANLTTKIKSGKATAADIAKAQALASGLGAERSAAGKEMAAPSLSFGEKIAVGASSIVGGSGGDEIIAQKQRNAAQSYDAITKTLAAFTAALQNATKTASNVDSRRQVPKL